MITRYLREAIRRAKYEILEDGTYYGWIEELAGVWAAASNLEECRDELESVVEDWLLPGLRLGHNITPLGDIDLTLTIPNPHPEDIGVPLLKEILKRAGISREQWLAGSKRN